MLKIPKINHLLRVWLLEGRRLPKTRRMQSVCGAATVASAKADAVHQYIEANFAVKEKALARIQGPDTTNRRFRASDAF